MQTAAILLETLVCLLCTKCLSVGMTEVEIELAMSRSATSATEDALLPANDASQPPPFAGGYFVL